MNHRAAASIRDELLHTFNEYHSSIGVQEVPMAFQSALAGILLAAELVIDAGCLRESPLPARTEIDLLRFDVENGPLTRLNSPAKKHRSGRCVCQDEVYRRAYTTKYLAEAAD